MAVTIDFSVKELDELRPGRSLLLKQDFPLSGSSHLLPEMEKGIKLPPLITVLRTRMEDSIAGSADWHCWPLVATMTQTVAVTAIGGARSRSQIFFG